MSLPARAPRRSRIAHFKTPFVVAVLAPVAALDAGCGGQADQSEPPIRTDAESSACPERAPAVGSACSLEALSCHYGSAGNTDPYCPDPGRRCLDGIWQLDAYSCNPPPPRLEICPDATPEIGTSCASYVPGLACGEYPYCYGTVAQTQCNGSTLLWEPVPLFSCNPPAPPLECPPQAPVLGSGCYLEGQECVYGTCGDPDDPRSTPLCQNGVWVQLEVLLCPTVGEDAGADNAADAGIADAGIADAG